MRTDEFDYFLPATQIAQRPLAERDAARMLCLDRVSGRFSDRTFRQLPELLRGSELLVFNNARVIPARLFGRRAGLPAQKSAGETGRQPHPTGSVEVFLVRRVKDDTWQALVRPGRKLPVGERVSFGGGELEAEILARGELGLRTVRFSSRDASPPFAHIERLGHTPLPPYIEREDEGADRERYQTVFAKAPGAVAAPTAGLHFSPAMLEKLRAQGMEMREVTLDVGLGTFQPIHAESLEEHVMHAEAYEISTETAEAVTRARLEGRRVVAIGTTVVRALEDAARRAKDAGVPEAVLSGRAEARIFLTPGSQFHAVDALLTNFHLPRSTLLALVSAFAGRENVLRAYQHAVEAGYRFYSYGDCMFIA